MWFCIPQSDSFSIKSIRKREGQYAGMSDILTFAWSTDRNALVITVRNKMVNGVRNLQYNTKI